MANILDRTALEVFESLEQIAKQIYPDKDWSGLQTGGFPWLLAKMIAANSELIINSSNFRSREAYVATAELQRTLKRLAKNIGLSVRARAGATVTLTIVASDDVTIPKGTSFSSDNGLVFSSLSELVLSTATSLSGSVSALHSDYTQNTSRSIGEPRERIELNRDNVLPTNIALTVNGTTWTKADDLSSATSSSQIYLIDYNDLNQVIIQFGDGVYGERLPADAAIIADIYSGGGLAGNAVPSATITSLNESFTNSGNITSITNTAASGGREEDDAETIRSDIPAQARNISGLINNEDIASVLRSSLSWMLDATVNTGYSINSNGTTIPAVSVIALPTGTDVANMSSAQLTELNSLLEDRGLLGVLYDGYNAIDAPIEIDVSVKISDRNAQDQTTTAIKSALTGDGGLFDFDNARFAKEYSSQDVISSIESVANVVRADINRFAKIPQTYVAEGASDTDSTFEDLELDVNSEDGYVVFDSTSTTVGDVYFMQPFSPTQIGSDFVTDSSKNFLIQQHDFEGSELNDASSPYIKTNGSSKIEFKQKTRVWETDQFNGSDFNSKHVLRVSWFDANDDLQVAYYHIADTTAPDVITTTEDADSPISGTAITTLASSDISSIELKIIKDKTSGSTGGFNTKSGSALNITHNNENTLYFDSNPIGTVPVNDTSFIRFNDSSFNITTSVYDSAAGVLRVRFDSSDFLVATDQIHVYTTSILSKSILFKHPREIFTLANSNITIHYV